MVNNILEIQGKDVKNFESVYKELIRQKVGIIYKIAQEKNENFINLLNEFVPEANDFSEVWENEYIFNNKNSNTKDKPKKLILNKKVVLKNNNNSIEKTQVKIDKSENELGTDKIEPKLSEVTENNIVEEKNNKMDMKSTEVKVDMKSTEIKVDNTDNSKIVKNDTVESLSKIKEPELKIKKTKKMPKSFKVSNK